MLQASRYKQQGLLNLGFLKQFSWIFQLSFSIPFITSLGIKLELLHFDLGLISFLDFWPRYS